MFQSISKNFLRSALYTKIGNHTILQCDNACHKISNSINRQNFGTKKRRIVELKSSTINLQSFDNIQQQVKQEAKQSYLSMRHKIQSLPWQQMSFDELCSLNKDVIDALQIELKKDKFNISDEQFIANQLKNGKQIPLGTYNQLDQHYKKVYSLLKNTNDFYDQYPNTDQIKKGYLHQIYLTDLKKDKELILTLSRFIKHIAKPEKLQSMAEPSFVKYLLSLKRQLLLQGIHFETKAQKKQTRNKKQNIVESNEQQQLPNIKILQILNYEYEFWQDVKHNRAKNGSESDFMIQTKQVPNPNQSVLLKELYPTVKIKYIARHKSLKDSEKCFCLKADLLIEIDDKMKRRIKVEWKGPSDRKQNQKVLANKKKSSQNQQDQEGYIAKVGYMVIDYENIYDGNPTIRPVFYF